MLSSDLWCAAPQAHREKRARPLWPFTPSKIVREPSSAAALAMLLRWCVRCPCWQRWQVRELVRGRPGLGPWLSGRSRPTGGAQVACLLPQAPKRAVEERALAGQGQPRIAAPIYPPGVKRRFSSGTSRASPATLPERAVLVRPGPWQLRAFSLCAGRWRAAVYAPKNRLRAFWSRGG